MQEGFLADILGSAARELGLGEEGRKSSFVIALGWHFRRVMPFMNHLSAADDSVILQIRHRHASIMASAALWGADFAIFCLAYYPILSRPRRDGQEG